jgi:hypothetical protein
VQPAIQEPDTLALEEARLEHERTLHKADKGWIGHLCGSRNEKPGNVAFLVILGSFLLVCAAMYENGLSEPFFKFLTVLLGVVGTALGYLFGSQTRH